jgi:hypothetical protein
VDDSVSGERPHVKGQDVETPISERRAPVLMELLMEALQVMSLLQVKALVQVFVLLLLKALLKVAKLFSLLSPLTQPQTTMPQTRPGGA